MPDMHGLTFTVSIPVFFKSKQREEVRRAKEEELRRLKYCPFFKLRKTLTSIS
jgi:hypothetical protein